MAVFRKQVHVPQPYVFFDWCSTKIGKFLYRSGTGLYRCCMQFWPSKGALPAKAGR